MTKTSAFTLTELIIVIAVLGILAAIVIPKFSSATEEARSSGAMSQLVSVRKQIEVWKLDHNGTYPTLSQVQSGAADWAVFTSKTLIDGSIDSSGSFGPYFPTPPVNNYTNSSLVVEAGSPVNTAGWTYNDSNGALKLIIPQTTNAASTGISASDFEQP